MQNVKTSATTLANVSLATKYLIDIEIDIFSLALRDSWET